MRIPHILQKLISTLKKPKQTPPIETVPESELDPLPRLRINIELLEVNLQEVMGSLFQPSQMDGYRRIIKEFETTFYPDIRWLAYMLATTLHETAHTMRPVTEYGSQLYLKGKKYYPFIGRGYVQLTWDYNYRKYGIEKTPERALDPDFAAYILVDGMIKGVFTGKKLSDYFSDLRNDPYNARRIINGIDRANLISLHHEKILKALEKSKVIGPIENKLPIG